MADEPEIELLNENGIRFSYRISSRTTAFHRSSDLLINGAHREGAELHWYRIDDEWQLGTIVLTPAVLAEHGQVQLKSLVGKAEAIEVREFGVEVLGVKKVDLQTTASLITQTDFRGDDAAFAEPPQLPTPNSPSSGDFVAQPPTYQAPPNPGFAGIGTIGGLFGDMAPLATRRRESVLQVETKMQFDTDDWANPWSIRAWKNAITELTKAKPFRIISSGTSFLGRPNVKTSLKDALLIQHNLAKEVMSEATERARLAIDMETLVEYFDFPPETRAACEQYLAYFSQFLRDLGIESDIQVKEEANRVLFSVRPKDGIEALSAVREALSVFLKLPALSDHERHNLMSNDAAAIQLEANVQHLRSQILLAKATMQLQVATLQAQQQTIDAQATTIMALETAQKQVTRPATDSEPIIGTAVSVTKVRKFGVEVDLPKIVRSLRRSPFKK